MILQLSSLIVPNASLLRNLESANAGGGMNWAIDPRIDRRTGPP